MRFDGKTNKQRALTFNMTELSGVTSPAHTGANVTIFKMGDLTESYKSVFLQAVADQELQHKLDLQTRIVWDTIWQNECALRDALRVAAETAQPFEPVIIDYVASLARSLLNHEDNNMSAELQKQLDEATVKISTLTALVGMNDAQRAFYDKLDDVAKASFRTLDNTTRGVMVEAAKISDEVLKVNGVDILKSAVGDATFQVLKNQQVVIESQREESEVAKFTALANSAEYVAIPGEPVAKSQALRAIDALPDSVKSTITAMLKAGAEAMKSRNTPAGAKVELDGMSPQDKLNALAKGYAEKNGVTVEMATVKVLETPEGNELYNLIDKGV